MATAHAPRSAIRNVRAVLQDRIVDDATVVCVDGRIESVVAGGGAPDGALDGGGMLLLPGLVDTHSDGLEKEVAPRRTVSFPLDFALGSFEARVRAAGITTMFHGVGFEEREQYGRSIDKARTSVDTIVGRRTDALARVEHRVLYRVEARSPEGVEAALERIDHESHLWPDEVAVRTLPVVSFEDHTPGQGQFRDVEAFKDTMDRSMVPDGFDVDTFVDAMVAEARAAQSVRDRNLARLSSLAFEGRIRMLAHDCEGAEDVAIAHEQGAAVAEFPLSVDAAREARRRGMPVVMGAPNALRGKSHSGNVPAAALVREGLCDVLASDYQPSSLLASAFELARANECSLPAAIRLVTLGPAMAMGLEDRGRIEAGVRADLVLVSDRGRWPEVRWVRRAPELVANTVG